MFLEVWIPLILLPKNLFSGNLADDAFFCVVADVCDVGNVVCGSIGGVVGDTVVAE